MKSIKNVALVSGLLLPTFGWAVEATPRGELQIQANYYEPSIAANSRWTLTTPESSIGITAVEQAESSQFIVQWQAGIDPMASGDEITLTQQVAYLRFNQGVVSLWGGRLPTLEQTYLVDLYQGAYSAPNAGLQLPVDYLANENKALRVDVASGNYLMFSGQWVVDENATEKDWGVAVALRTPEGSVSVVYQDPVAEGESARWGNLVSWQGDSTVLSALWFHQDEVIGWNLAGRTKWQSVESFITYGKGADEVEYYTAGIQQQLTPALMNFSEFQWQPDVEGWQWSTGFKVEF